MAWETQAQQAIAELQRYVPDFVLLGTVAAAVAVTFAVIRYRRKP